MQPVVIRMGNVVITTPIHEIVIINNYGEYYKTEEDTNMRC